MQVEEPATWLLANANLGWVYAPIMDRSRPPTHDGTAFGSWIARRAHRSALASRGRVVVSNSMPLSEKANGTNAAKALPYPPIVDCHVDLLVDARGEIVTAQSLTAPLGSSDVFPAAAWDGWATFP